MVPTGRNAGRVWISAWVVGAVAWLVTLGCAGQAEAQTGLVTGRVTSAATGAPVTTGAVTLCSASACTNYPLNGVGIYTATVAAGSYVAHTEVLTGFVNEIFNDLPCPFDCLESDARTSGAPIAVASGATVIRDFALAPEGTVSGTVSDAATGAGVANASVVLLTRTRGFEYAAARFTDAAGAFSFGAVSGGTYASLINSQQYVSEIFGDIPCVFVCRSSTALDLGAPITVSTGAVTSGIGFVLEPGATIQGTIRRQGTAIAAVGVFVTAHLRIGTDLVIVTGAATNGSGQYVITGLPAGRYVVSTSSSAFIDQVYDGRPCAADCSTAEQAAGLAIDVAPRAVVSNIDFALSPGGTVTGQLTDAGIGTNLVGRAQMFRVTGAGLVPARSVATNSSGVFSVTGLPSGSYVMMASEATHASGLFGGLQVPPNPTNEELLAGTRITVTEGVTTPNINVALNRASFIKGRVRTAGTLAPPIDTVALAFQGGTNPRAIAFARTDANGDYLLTGFGAGTYFVASLALHLDNQAYNGVPCPGNNCTAAFVTSAGTPISTTAGVIRNNIDFTLPNASGPPFVPALFQVRNVPGGVQISWAPSTDGNLATSYLLEAGLTPGTTFASAPLSGTSIVLPGIPPGTYFIRVRGVNAAGAGAATTDFTLRIGPGGVAAPRAPFRLSPLVSGGRLTATWTPDSVGPVATGYQLEVGTAPGRTDIGAVSVATPVFQFTGVPPGVYFVRVRALVGAVAGPPSADEMMVVGGVPAPPSEPAAFTTTVSGNVLTLQWEPPLFGPLTEYLIEAGSQPDAADIGAVRTGNTNTTLTVPGVPPGRYYLRVRAINAQGVGLPSVERQVVVP